MTLTRQPLYWLMASWRAALASTASTRTLVWRLSTFNLTSYVADITNLLGLATEGVVEMTATSDALPVAAPGEGFVRTRDLTSDSESLMLCA